MLSEENRKKTIVGGAVLAILILSGSYLVNSLRPVTREGSFLRKTFEIKRGDGFFAIVKRLKEEDLVRSSLSFGKLAILTGSARELKPGTYSLSPSMSSFHILATLARGPEREVVVRIPDGKSLYEIDGILADAGVFPRGSLISYASSSPGIEGRLFPDTYRFFTNAPVREVVEKFHANFNKKAEPILGGDVRSSEILTIASILENEVPEYEDRRIVAGIVKKRMNVGMKLQMDATLCYMKEVAARAPLPCYPLTSLDFKYDSPYNTYLYKGLPPGPIGNPGTSSIRAALNPKPSPYWFYLSDPETKRTVWSETLDEHEDNRVKYLKVNR